MCNHVEKEGQRLREATVEYLKFNNLYDDAIWEDFKNRVAKGGDPTAKLLRNVMGEKLGSTDVTSVQGQEIFRKTICECPTNEQETVICLAKETYLEVRACQLPSRPPPPAHEFRTSVLSDSVDLNHACGSELSVHAVCGDQ